MLIKKRIFTWFILTAAFLIVSNITVLAQGEVPALPSSSNITINGRETFLQAYNIEGRNYFKIRDLAMALSGTGKQFDVGYDENLNGINLTSGKPYTITGDEGAQGDGAEKTAIFADGVVYLDGVETVFTIYNIEGSNYFQIMDIGRAFDFSVEWDEALGIIIDTEAGVRSDYAVMSITGSIITDGLLDVPPSITITNAPEGTACFSVTITGPSPLGEWICWSAAGFTDVNIQENTEAVTNGIIQGLNSWGEAGYGGLLPDGVADGYTVTVSALKGFPVLAEGYSAAQFNMAADGMILESVSIKIE